MYVMMGRVPFNNGGSGATTAVSNAFIESYMTDANDVQLKVYLYLLYAMNASIQTNVSDLAERLNYSENDIVRAIRYWEGAGLVQTEFDANGILSHLRVENLIPETRSASVMVTPQKMSGALSASALSTAAPAQTLAFPQARPARFAARTKSAAEEKARQQLMRVIEQYIGKQLSVKDVEVVDFIREELQFPDELTDYLVQYCVELGKKRFSYIRTVAVDWHERGIKTVEAAVAESARFEAAKKERVSNAKNKGRTAMEQYKNYPQNQYDFAALEAKVVQN